LENAAASPTSGLCYGILDTGFKWDHGKADGAVVQLIRDRGPAILEMQGVLAKHTDFKMWKEIQATTRKKKKEK